jgi:hypothetical protein
MKGNGAEKGLTRAGVAVVVGSLLILLLAIPIVGVLRSYVDIGMSLSSGTTSVGVDGSMTYTRVGKDVRATLTLVNRTATTAEVVVTDLVVGKYKLVTTPTTITKLAGYATFQKDYTLAGAGRVGLDEKLNFEWKSLSGSMTGSSSSSSTAMLP